MNALSVNKNKMFTTQSTSALFKVAFYLFTLKTKAQR